MTTSERTKLHVLADAECAALELAKAAARLVEARDAVNHAHQDLQVAVSQRNELQDHLDELLVEHAELVRKEAARG